MAFRLRRLSRALVCPFTHLSKVAPSGRFERPTSGLEDRRSDPLSYEGVGGKLEVWRRVERLFMALQASP